MSITRRTLNEDTMSWMPVAEGFGMGASLIMMIGAQNAFVLQKGLQGQHRLPIALSCAMSDAILITLGVAGAGALILAHPTLLEVARWGGVAFLLWFGWAALRRAWQGESLLVGDGERGGLKTALLATFAVTWLNPHVYLDTVVLLGSLSAQQPEGGRYLFGLGASLASLTWFLSLAFGARLLAPLFARPVSWRVLDSCMAAFMLSLALGLALN